MRNSFPLPAIKHLEPSVVVSLAPYFNRAQNTPYFLGLFSAGPFFLLVTFVPLLELLWIFRCHSFSDSGVRTLPKTQRCPRVTHSIVSFHNTSVLSVQGQLQRPQWIHCGEVKRIEVKCSLFQENRSNSGGPKKMKTKTKTKNRGYLSGSTLVWLSENLADFVRQRCDHRVWVSLCFSQVLPCCCWKFYLS